MDTRGKFRKSFFSVDVYFRIRFFELRPDFHLVNERKQTVFRNTSNLASETFGITLIARSFCLAVG